jgi:hypothetical protein
MAYADDPEVGISLQSDQSRHLALEQDRDSMSTSFFRVHEF